MDLPNLNKADQTCLACGASAHGPIHNQILYNKPACPSDPSGRTSDTSRPVQNHENWGCAWKMRHKTIQDGQADPCKFLHLMLTHAARIMKQFQEDGKTIQTWTRQPNLDKPDPSKLGQADPRILEIPRCESQRTQADPSRPSRRV